MSAVLPQAKTFALVNIGRDFKRGIAHSHQLPIPRLPRDAMPLQFEWRRQGIDAFGEQFHHVIVIAKDRDPAAPHRASLFDLHKRVGCDDSGAAHISETFPYTLQNARLIVAPLILIIAADKIRRSRPILALNRVEKIFRVTLDLPRWLPKPDEIQPNKKRDDNADDEFSTK